MKTMILNKGPRWGICLCAISFALNGCFVEVTEDPEAGSQYNWNESDIPPQAQGASVCESNSDSRYSGQSTDSCFETPDYTWRANCKSEECQEVPVYIHYMLTEDLGESNTVALEAFDNPRYLGNPVATVQVHQFSAAKPGDYADTSIYLAPGTYYMRAYIANEDELVAPYSYGDMELISEKPVGIYGALSSPAAVSVEPREMERWADPVHLVLDKLFKKDEPAEESRAYLRIKFSLSEEDVALVDVGRDVVIQLHEDTDLARTPQAELTMPSERFLIEGQKGKAEFISESLNVGKYYLFVFLDDNGNGYYDEGELAQIRQKAEEPALVSIDKDRTTLVEMTLLREPNLPLSEAD